MDKSPRKRMLLRDLSTIISFLHTFCGKNQKKIPSFRAACSRK
ncbi:hypothetical protein GCWU000341_00054 [Oribacterium sp. oral taxon 078 str. F0262]|nr:hypothetical protein GCWU000341_00054 [Oribacterium sp. oral taxon 078 str. F0262]